MHSNQEKQQQHSGWSTLQIQILQELVGTARRMGDPVAAARHMAFVIQNLDADLTPTEKAELCQQLNVLTAKVRRVADGEMDIDSDHICHPLSTTLPSLENCRYILHLIIRYTLVLHKGSWQLHPAHRARRDHPARRQPLHGARRRTVRAAKAAGRPAARQGGQGRREGLGAIPLHTHRYACPSMTQFSFYLNSQPPEYCWVGSLISKPYVIESFSCISWR